jgi:peptide/nickel transport system substrate-binding protein
MDPTNPKIFFTTFRYASFRSKILEGFRVIPKHLEEPILRQAQGDIEKYLKTTLYETNPVHPGLYLGPYVITRYEKGLRVELSSNPFYFGQKASIKKINIRPGLSRQSALALIQSGEIGMIAASGLHTDEYLYLQEQLKTTKGTESIKMVVGDSIVLEQISLNLRNPILNDRRIRQALRTSIDPADILNRLNLIVGIPANSFLHPTDPNVISATEIISDRMKQAGHQLEQAGWMKGSDGLRRKNQIPLSLDFDFASDSEVRAFIVKSIKSTWETLGIQVHLKPSPQKHFFDQILPYMHYSGLALFAWTMPVETNSMAMFESQNIPTSSNQQEGTNISAWRNHQVNKLIAEAEAELDNDKRKHLLHQIQTHYFNDSPGIPLYFKHQVAFIPSSIEGYAIPGHQYPETIWIERWEWNPEKHP